MPCAELENLRSEAKRLRMELANKRAKARSFGPKEGRKSGDTDYEPYLRRQIMTNESRIQEHLHNHGCERQNRE
jgi:hypothetical protein